MTNAGRNPLRIQENRFFDTYGRQVILHGICLVDKNPKSKYLGYNDPAIFRQFREWGFNCVRLGIIWEGLESQPVVLNDEYLKGIDSMINAAHKNGLYVLLEMHQDLYSSVYGSGAPIWATIIDEKAHYDVSDVRSDAYFTSPAVQAAFDHFWNNTNAIDRVGLQDHYAAVWKNIARRYANHPAVIGYDIFNEPQPGAVSGHAQVVMFTKAAKIILEGGWLDEYFSQLPEDTDPVEALLHIWIAEEGRLKILKIFEDMNLYQAFIESQQPFIHQFEKEKLMPMVRKMAKVIRKVDPAGFLFLETARAASAGLSTALETVQTDHGKKDPNQVFAPHIFDMVTGTSDLSSISPARVEMIFKRHQESARRLDLPMFVGAWGAFGKQDNTLKHALQLTELFEETQCSDTYWSYFDGMEKAPSFPAIQRPYPMKINGRLTSYHYDPEKEKFSLRWMEYGKSTQPTYVYLPDWFDVSQCTVSLSADTDYQLHPVTRGSKNTILAIPPTGKTNARWLTIH